MTPEPIRRIPDVISDVIGGRIRELRERTGMSRDDLAAAAIDAGGPSTLSGTVIRFLETGRPGKDGVRTRFFTFDEMLGLAAGLEVSPLELLGDQAVLFVGDDPAPTPVRCRRCGAPDGPPGVMEQTVRRDMEALAELGDLEASLAATAIRLAVAIDQETSGEGVKLLAGLTRELRAALEQIAAGRRRTEPPDEDDDEFGDLDEPDDGPDLSGLDGLGEP